MRCFRARQITSSLTRQNRARARQNLGYSVVLGWQTDPPNPFHDGGARQRLWRRIEPLGRKLLVAPGVTAQVVQSTPQPTRIALVYKGIEQGVTAEGFPYLGRADAPITLTDYSDFL